MKNISGFFLLVYFILLIQVDCYLTNVMTGLKVRQYVTGLKFVWISFVTQYTLCKNADKSMGKITFLKHTT